MVDITIFECKQTMPANVWFGPGAAMFEDTGRLYLKYVLLLDIMFMSNAQDSIIRNRNCFIKCSQFIVQLLNYYTIQVPKILRKQTISIVKLVLYFGQ